MIIGYLVYLFNLPPLFPDKQNVIAPFFFAAFAAENRFLLFPEVVSAIHTSPLPQRLSICFEKISSKLKSLDIAVIFATSVVNANELNG